MANVSIQGLDKIELRLQALPEKLRRTRIRQAMNDGMEIVRAEAEHNARRSRSPYAPHLSDNIVKKVTIGAQKATGRIGATNVHHGHLVEFGVRPHMIGKRYHPGAKKQPWMRPAFDGKSDESVEVMITQLAKSVEEEV